MTDTERDALQQQLQALTSREAALVRALEGRLDCDHCGMNLGAAHHWGNMTTLGNHRFTAAALRGPEARLCTCKVAPAEASRLLGPRHETTCPMYRGPGARGRERA